MILPFTRFREVEANPLTMKFPIFGLVKIRALASFFMARFLMGSILDGSLGIGVEIPNKVSI